MRFRCAFLTVAVATVIGCGPRPTPSPSAPALTPALPLPADQRVENPAYTRWATAAPGTVVTYDEVTEVAGAVTRGRRTYKLVSRTEDVAVVESQDLNPADDKAVGEPQTLKQFRWMGKPTGKEDAADPARPQGTYATGTETVTVGGKAYPAKWYKYKGRVEAGETDTQAWYSAEAVGGLVKSVHAIPAAKKSVTTELTGVKAP